MDEIKNAENLRQAEPKGLVRQDEVLGIQGMESEYDLEIMYEELLRLKEKGMKSARSKIEKERKNE